MTPSLNYPYSKVHGQHGAHLGPLGPRWAGPMLAPWTLLSGQRYWDLLHDALSGTPGWSSGLINFWAMCRLHVHLGSFQLSHKMPESTFELDVKVVNWLSRATSPSSQPVSDQVISGFVFWGSAIFSWVNAWLNFLEGTGYIWRDAFLVVIHQYISWN